ncbi:YlmH family RNA-binding protein [Desmospora profundinema]|uniref:RNA-binding protein YlmH n=1 Tax=Desmospora profundinema TaxID=1571184 RepID=A0ABU1IJR8_9BACL|nr:YlmH/Sll1252 family protein [Desmospora profundinema]MDR6224782.1 RNA-binding protein YlmH [Desmospora profundinema]
MGGKEAWFRHFRPEERVLAERVLDWMTLAEVRYQPVLTPFLNPREQRVATMVINRSTDLSATADGGYEGAERCRMKVLPPYVEDADHGLAYLSLEPAERGRDLRHPDVLGSLLGLGLKRDKLGDILPFPGGCHVVVAEELAEFIRSQLNRIGRHPVHVETIQREELIVPETRTETVSVSVASLRLDAVLAEGFRLSRSRVSTAVKNGNAQINWKTTGNPAETVEEGDVLSLRGSGRIQVGEKLGVSKKGRFLLNLIRSL